jgi:hypothetical protein
MYRLDVILLNRLNRFPVFSMSGFAYLLRLANRYYIQGNCVSINFQKPAYVMV